MTKRNIMWSKKGARVATEAWVRPSDIDIAHAETRLRELGHAVSRCQLSFECNRCGMTCGLSASANGPVLAGRAGQFKCEAS